jgi:hypothetical protein
MTMWSESALRSNFPIDFLSLCQKFRRTAKYFSYAFIGSERGFEIEGKSLCEDRRSKSTQ